MKHKLFLLSMLCFFGLTALAQKIQLIPEQSTVTFRIKNWGLNVDGKFSDIQVSGTWHPESPSKSSLNGTVKAKSIDANIDARNESLRSEDYFNVLKFPEIKITSVSINKTSEGFLFKGFLEMKDVKRSIEFPFTAKKEGNNWVFDSEFEIDRLNYHVGSSSMVMSDDVRVFLHCVVKISG